ncbi:MAG: hypothetical protein CFE21_08070 [Bacteroidetes bacterium B1(2017)]|nr:MAG: hypothetical protein CFE21_08070 [Bacteroidetes bacterium B1(2017)]
MQEFSLSRFWKIFFLILSPIGVTALSIFIFRIDFKNDSNPYLLVGFCLAGIAILILAIIDAYYGKFVIAEDKVYTKGIFNNKELYLDEISGYREENKHIIIETNALNRKQIKISTYYGNTGDILLWLSYYYKNLDAELIDIEKEEILNNPHFGWTEEERAQKLHLAQSISTILNIVGFIVGVWLLFYPKPYQPLMFGALLIPLLVIGIIKYFKGLIKLNEKEKSAYPSLTLALILPALILCIRGISDYNLIDSSSIILPSSILSLSILVFLLVNHKELEYHKAKDLFVVLIIYAILFGYSFGIIISLNGLLDKSAPQYYSSTILSKRTSSGKYTSYYFEIDTWGKQNEPEEISISRQKYDSLEPGQVVTVELKNGFFNMPWYHIK